MGDAFSVSVIVPVFNDAAYLGEAIESILRQTRAPSEIIVVDDGSSDDSPRVASSFGGRVTLHCREHAGAGAARNYGVSQAKGDLLAFLDADDLWHHDKLARQIDVFREQPSTEVVFSHLEHFYSPDLDPLDRKRFACPAGAIPCTTAVAMLVKRLAFDRVGNFDDSRKLGEVVDWSVRARDQGLVAVLLKDVLVRRRIHAGNTGITRASDRRDYVSIVKAALDRRRLSDSAKAQT